MANLVLAVLLCGACFFAFPAKSSEYSLRKEAAFAKKYLRTFYDFNIQQSRVSRRQYNNAFSRKLREMQRFFGLKETGKLDPATLEVMHQPRCGVSDMGESKSSNAIKLWGKDKLTYSFENYTPDLPKDLVEDAINRAFQEWSKHIPLTFKQSSSKADIMISFFTKGHLSCSAFDGPGNTLAHAYSPGPGIGGDVHFDEDEKWAVVTEGVNLTVVAAHEFGHALGLPHSSNINALMYPNYENKPTDLLNTDDIEKIKAFYPAQKKKGKLFREPNALEDSDESGEPEEPEEPSRCPPGPSFDAVATLGGETLFFKDDYMWRQITLDMPPEHYPINHLWSTLPSNIEAAYEYSTTTYNIFFFKGTKFWVTEDFDVRSDSPKDISQLGFPKSVKNIDAAVHDENTGKTFFFVKSQYWSYDEENKSMDVGFPKPIASGFPGIGIPVHSAFQKNGFLFFFDSQNLYQFDNKKKRVVNTSGENKWLKC